MTIPFGSSASLADLLTNRPQPDPNSIGRFFLATDISVIFRDNGAAWIPASPLVYAAIVTQVGEDAPTATILFNTLPNLPTWSRFLSGTFRLSLTDAFPLNKTMVSVTHGTPVNGDIFLAYNQQTADFIEFSNLDSTGSPLDEFSPALVKIEVYP